MLDICSIGHDEVCYEGSYCPACALKDLMQIKIDSLQRDNDLLTVELDMVREALEKTDNDKISRWLPVGLIALLSFTFKGGL